MLLNILPDGGTIRMELADGTEECMFSVSDNGAGISEGRLC